MPPLLKNISIPNLFTQFRYITRVKETPWKRKYLRRFGYDDPLLKRPGLFMNLQYLDVILFFSFSLLMEIKKERSLS